MRRTVRDFFWMGGSATPWWLGNGAVDESDTYTVYDPLAAADLATSYVNLANPGVNDAEVGVAPTLDEGWVFNGTTQHLLMRAGADRSNIGNTTTIIAWLEDIQSGVFAFGYSFFGVPNRNFYFRPISGTQKVFGKGPSQKAKNQFCWGVVVAMNQTNGFINGNPEVTFDAWSGASPPNIFFALGAYNSGTPTAPYEGMTVNNFCAYRLLRIAVYPTSLTQNQIEAVVDAMIDYQRGSINTSYLAALNALNPEIVYPCNEGYGSILLDHSGNKYHGEAYKCIVGQPGLLGNAVTNDGTPQDTIRPNMIYVDTNPDLNEFSFSCIFKPSASNVPSQVYQTRIFETHHAATANSPLGDYYAAEMRSNNELQIYFKEDGATQVQTGIVNLTADEWYHLVFYNSLSGGVFGVYVNGTKYEFAKTSVVGFTGALQPSYPYMNDESDSLIQYCALYHSALNQTQVDSINPIE